MGFAKDGRSVGPGAALACAVATGAWALGMMACTGHSAPLAGPPSAPPTFVTPAPVPTAASVSQSASPEQTGEPLVTPGRPPGTIPVYGTIRVRIVPLKPGPGVESA